MDWISVENGLPPENYPVYVMNGKNKYIASYCEKKWIANWKRDIWDEREDKCVELHKVHKWAYEPITGLKIPVKDFEEYMKRAKKFNHQIQKKKLSLRY